MIDYLIIDDETIAHRIIEGYAKNFIQLNLKANCYDAFEAIEKIKKYDIDLIFLDINMPKLKGFEFLKTLQNPPQVIVTTAYEEFALEGFELNVVDYLLKPFSLNRFAKAINKLEKDTEIEIISSIEKTKQLMIKGDKKYHQVRPEEILFIEASGNYAKIQLTDKLILSHEKISNYDKLLSSKNFIRVHRSFIIAKDKIDSVDGNRIQIKKYEIPIGQSYKIGFFKNLDIH